MSQSFTEEQRKRFAEDLEADSVMFLKLKPFTQRLRQLASEMQLELRAGVVKYDDFSVNNKQRLDAIQEDDTNILFWKDKSLMYQNEYRIVVAGYGSDQPLTLQVGDLSEFATIHPIEKVLNGDFILKLENQK